MINRWLTWANAITAVRIIATPLIGYYMVQERWGLVLLLAGFAVASDFLDGFVARMLQQQSVVGAVLDHTADKLLMITMLAIVILRQLPELPAWFCWMVLSKEILLFLIAALIFIAGWVVTIMPLKIGKIAMAAQMGLLLWLLGAKAFALPLPTGIIWAVALLEFVAIGAYMLSARFLVGA